MKLQTGDQAQDFETVVTFLEKGKEKAERKWKLSEEVTRRPVLLVFYPGDFTPVCTKQLCDYRDRFDGFSSFDVQIVGVSTNTKDSHALFIKELQLPFGLLDDSSKEISRTFGMLSMLGTSKRGFVLIDRSQKIKYLFAEVLPIFRRTSDEVQTILKNHLT